MLMLLLMLPTLLLQVHLPGCLLLRVLLPLLPLSHQGLQSGKSRVQGLKRLVWPSGWLFHRLRMFTLLLRLPGAR
jgi:hypothetical protein